jgi:sarcosine oxidase gamma subunit
VLSLAESVIQVYTGCSNKLRVTSVDIFRVDASGVLWLETATDLQSAKARVEALGPGEYLISDPAKGDKVQITIKHVANERVHSPPKS